MPAPKNKTKTASLPVKEPDAIKGILSWWSSVVNDPRFPTVLDQARENSRVYQGVQDTPHGQVFASGHNEGIGDFATALLNLSVASSDEDGEFMG